MSDSARHHTPADAADPADVTTAPTPRAVHMPITMSRANQALMQSKIRELTIRAAATAKTSAGAGAGVDSRATVESKQHVAVAVADADAAPTTSTSTSLSLSSSSSSSSSSSRGVMRKPASLLPMTNAESDQAQLHAKMRALMSDATTAAKSTPPGTWTNAAGASEPRKTTVPVGWTTWLRTNLDLGQPATTLIDIMFKEHGYAHSAVLDAMQRVNVERHAAAQAKATGTATATGTANTSSSAAAHVSEAYTQRKSKYTLDLINWMDEMDTRPRTITERATMPSLTDFRQDFASKSRPLLVHNAPPADWPVNRWTFDYFVRHHGTERINVQAGRAADAKYEEKSVSHRTDMTMAEFVRRLRTGTPNDVYMTANNAAQNRPLMSKLLGTLTNLGPSSDALLNMSAMTTRAFLWIGGKGTFTPLHHDNTNNGFVQVSGHKTVWLAPPTATTKLYNHSAVYSYVDPRRVDTAKYPLAAKVRWMKFTLGPGDFLFIPQGWWHAVEGVDENVSVSFTCWNSCITHFAATV